MQATVLTEAAGTTADDPTTSLCEYYQGQFGSVQNLIEGFPDAVETDVYFADPSYGLADGSQSHAAVTSDSPVGSDEMVTQTQSMLTDAVADADIIVILLTTDAFTQIVPPIWSDLVEGTQSDAIWCLGTSRSALEGIDIAALEDTVGRVITYRRRGVARIGIEQKEALQDTITERVSK